MKRIIIVLLILIIPIRIKAIETSATSAILMDADNNRILYSKNIHEFVHKDGPTVLYVP